MWNSLFRHPFVLLLRIEIMKTTETLSHICRSCITKLFTFLHLFFVNLIFFHTYAVHFLCARFFSIVVADFRCAKC